MKAETFNLINLDVRRSLLDRIANIECNGKIQVTIGNIGSKTKRQQGLDWAWDGDIFKSGIGWGDKTVTQVHARGKWMFALPVILRNTDDFMFVSIYEHFTATYGKDKARCLEFSEDYISTQKMSVSDVAEYMTNKQHFWLEKGVNLTNPNLYGLKIK